MELLETEAKQVPLRLMFAFFNYVSLGQWQLARLSLHRLSEEIGGGALILDGSAHLELPALLRAIVLYPHLVWRYSPSIPSPYHLSWLCLTECKIILTEDERKLPPYIDDLVEFHILLHTVQNELKIESSFKKDVISYYHEYLSWLNSPSPPDQEVEPLSEETLSFLYNILNANRTIGDCILQLLIIHDTEAYTDNNLRLFEVYVRCIDDAVESLKGASAEEREAFVDRIYGILGVFDPPSTYQSKLKVGNLFIKLLQAEQFGLKRELTYNCCVGRSSSTLVRILSEVEALQFESQYKEVDFISRNSQLFEERKSKWSNIFLHAFYNKTHILQEILDRGLELVRENDFDSLSDLMRDPEWKPMSSLLLLLAWDHCKSMQSAKKLLDTLYHPEDQSSQPALFAAIQKLYYQVNLADWCIDKVRPILSVSSGSSLSSSSFQQEGDIFTRLESQSILYMLHQSNSLSSSDPKEIMELLKMSPSIGDIPGAQPTNIPKASSQARDIAVYKSFCAIRLTMDAILCSAQLSTLLRDEAGRSQLLEMLAFSKCLDKRFSSGEVFTTQQDSTALPEDPTYDDKSSLNADQSSIILAIDAYITKILDDVKNYLQSVHPLNYRLEILENIYSLLFLKYEELAVDGCDLDEKKNQNYTRCDLKEYLNLSISRNLGYRQNVSVTSVAETESSFERSSSLTASTGSLAREKRMDPTVSGFLVSRPMMEKMLQLLKDAIYDIQSSRYALRRDSTPTDQSPEQDQSIYSSIAPDSLHSRLTQLEKCINEANWRYKLVTTTETVPSLLVESGVSLSEEQSLCRKWEVGLSFESETQSSSDLDLSNDEDEINTVDRRHSSFSTGTGHVSIKSDVAFLSDREQKPKTSSPKMKLGDSGDEGDTEDKEIVSKPKSKLSLMALRKHKRNSDKCSNYTSNQNIVRKMLSSPVNLLQMCLKLGNFVSAYEVIKIFKLEGHIGAQIVHFAEKIESIGKQMTAVSNQDEEPSFDPIEIMSKETVSSEDFDRLTLSLTKNSAVMDDLINILVSTNLSKIMLSGDERLLLRSGESSTLKHLVNFVPSLIILDLLCTYDISYETSRELLKNATQKLILQYKAGSIPAPKLSRTPSAGSTKPLATKAFDNNFIFDNYSLSQPLKFLQTINEIIRMSGDLVLPLQLVRNGRILKTLTPHLLLTKFTDSFRPSHFVSLKKLREFQYRAVERLFKAVLSTIAIEEQGHFNDMTLDNVTSSLNDLFKAFSTNREGVLLPSTATTLTDVLAPDPLNQLDLDHLAPPETSKLTPDHLGVASLSIGEELDNLSAEFPQMNSMKYTYSYFDWFFQHLETIRSFLIKHNLEENVTALSSMVLLKESPSKIVARLIFEKQLRPELLEELAKLIRLDVVQIMIRFTCPPLNSSSKLFTAHPLLERDTPSLNPVSDLELLADQTVDGLLSHSERIVSLALDVLNARIQPNDEFLGFEYLSRCSEEEVFAQFEDSLQILNSLDLSQLNTDEEKIIFYTNIHNALSIHAAIRQSVLMRKEGLDLSIFGVTTLFSFFLQSCYSIGQLGLINLLDIQFKILKVHPLDDSFVASKGLRTLTYTSNKRDRFRDYCLKQSEARLVFVIGNCMLGNLKAEVLTRNNLKETLTESALSFCSSNIECRAQVVRDVKTIVVPEFLTWYSSHFNTKRELTYEQKRDLLVLNLQDFLPKSVQCTQFRTNIEIIPHIWRFGFFPVNGSVKLLEVSTTIHLSPFLEALNSRTPDSTQKYSLNESTLHYISSRSEILGKLATFVCLPNQPVTASKRVSSSEDEKQQSIRSQSSLGERGSIVSLSRMFARGSLSQGPECEDDAGFEKHVDRILNIFSDIPVLKAYFDDSFNTLTFARRITNFIRSESNENNSHINLQRIEMNPPLSFEQLPDGSARPLSFDIHELFLGDKSNESSIKTSILSLDNLIAKRRWINAFDIINSESFLPFKGCAWYQQLRDLILIGCANYIRRQREKNEEIANTRAAASSEEAFKFLIQLSNFEMLGEIVLDIIYEWNDTQLCLNILQHSYSNLNGETTLKNRIRVQLERLKIYSEILNTLTKPDQNPLSNEESVKSGGYPEWKHWRVIKRQTASMPLVIVRHLSRKGEFDLAKRWARVHAVPDPIHLHIEKENILFLFTKSDPDFSSAYLILEEFTPEELSAKLCLSLLESLTYPRQILFVVQFALQHLTPYLSGLELENLRKQQLGAQALLCIDSQSVLQYTKLTDDVALLIEQLIMNLKIQWAAQVVDRVTQNIKSTVSHLPRTPSSSYGTQLSTTIDEMAFKYAELAIDLRIITDNSADVCSPVVPSPGSGVPFQFEPIPEHTPDTTDSEGSQPVQTKPIPIKASVLPRTPKHIEPSSAPGNYMIGARKPSRTEFTKTVQESILEVGQVLVQTHAVQDIKVFRKAEWTPDQNVGKCQICSHIYFGILNRKHHCRKCGRVVCRDCSSHKYYVDGYQGLVRVCDSCQKSHYAQPQVEKADTSLKMRTGRRSSLGSTLAEKENSDSLFKPRHSYFWELIKNNREKNIKLRTEFYFEQAPNPDLCISIALLHSDSERVAEFLLCLAVRLSERLKDVFDSPEVDCLYVVDMIKKLLNKSKMLASMAESVEGVNKCDLYLDRIGLIQSFISIQDSEIEIPSLPQLSASDDTRYIRDALVRYSYWQLALDISTKCQLDRSSVWTSWGLSCLKDGRYDAARDKFKHCLQSVGSTSQKQAISQQNQALVSQIVEQIENSILPLWNSDEILNSLRKDNTQSIEAIVEAERRPANNTHMNTLQFEEVLFYLKSFGTQKQMLEFLVKYRLVKRACNYVQSQNCSSEIFREGLLIPCMKLCLWEDLKKEITSNDPSLRHWSYLFKESCDYFITKRNMYNIAYELQKFMKDHVNAAKTCILFYQNQKLNEPLLTYSTLYTRLHCLEEAKSHLTQAMDSKPSRQSKQEIKPLADLNSYLENIKLQIEVTKFFHVCLNKDLFTTCVKVGKAPLTQTPTLFGTPALKTKLAAEIITAPNNVNLGIELVVQIIKVFHLEACEVFSEATVCLLVAKRSEDLKLTMQCYRQRYKITELERDQVIINAVKEVPSASLDSEMILGLLSCDKSKVEVNIQLGRLRNAYLAAVKSNMVEEVKRIRQLAADKGDNAIREICERYLQQHDAKK